MEWRPIETAPKDKRILIANTTRIELASWKDESYSSEELVKEGPKQRVYEIVHHKSGYWDHHGDWFEPTHWMPLPEPPLAKPDEIG